MSVLARLKWFAAGLLAIGAITTAVMQADVGGKPVSVPSTPMAKPEVLATLNQFSDKPAITYTNPAGEGLFALQLKPELVAGKPRPRDVAIIIDASASQAGEPIENAKRTAAAVVASLSPADRVSIWLASTKEATRNLVKGGGLREPSASVVKLALTATQSEYGSGAVDLRELLTRVSDEFDGKTTRNQTILYLGDGESSLNPLSETDRYKLADELRNKGVSFYAVPFGRKINAYNLNAMVIGTGGTIVRPESQNSQTPETVALSLANRFLRATDVPVLNPAKFEFSSPAEEIFPTKLPPLRADSPTLVLGRFAKGKSPAKLEVKVEGKIAGEAANTKMSFELPVSSPENYFLLSMVNQWREAERRDAPALLRADRTLALACENVRLAREELVEQAEWALSAWKVEAAKELFDAAGKIDPADPRAKTGAEFAKKILSGEIPLDKLKAGQGKVDPRAVAQVGPGLPAAADPKDPVAPKGPAPKDDGSDRLKQEEARLKILEQRTTTAVEDTLAKARQLFAEGNPKGAAELVKAQRETVRSTPELSDKTRDTLINRMNVLLEDIARTGEAKLRERAEENERIARAKQRILAENQAAARQEKIRERIRNFGDLMTKARYEDAYREALVLEQEAIAEGRPPIREGQAVYRIGQVATNYYEARELVRIREDRFLQTMLSLEKSHIPYPDEPPIHFPPAKIWREVAERRKRYTTKFIGPQLTPREQEQVDYLRSRLREPLNGELPAGDQQHLGGPGGIIDNLSNLASPPDARINPNRQVNIIINTASFKRDKSPAAQMFNPDQFKVNIPADPKGKGLVGVPLETALRYICQQLPGEYEAHYIVRPGFIEIVSGSYALENKILGVFNVEELVVPIPVFPDQTAALGQIQLLRQFVSFDAFLRQNTPVVNNGGNLNNGPPIGGNNGQVPGIQNIGGALPVDFQQLLVVVVTNVDPDFWSREAVTLAFSGSTPPDPPANPPDVVLQNRMAFLPSSRSLIIRAPSKVWVPGSTGTRLHKREGDGMMNAPGLKLDDRQLAKMDQKEQEAAAKMGRIPDKNLDPEIVWNDALKNVNQPGLVLATADFLAKANEFKHVAELLKASLRKGLTIDATYQEALAIALEASQGSKEEIERARLSAIDLEPTDPQAYVRAAFGLESLGKPDEAIRLCKLAAKLDPNNPEIYVNALAFAENPKAPVAVDVAEFAAGTLLRRDWGLDGNEYHNKARAYLTETIKKLEANNRAADAEKLRKMSGQEKERDLVIQLLWNGPADLDLSVKEPVGSVCAVTRSHTVGGGVLLADQFGQRDDDRSEVYTATEAFKGTYEITVEKISGRPLADKATVKVIRNQGTANERIELFTVSFDKKQSIAKLSIHLDEGRRTELAAFVEPTAPGVKSYTVDKASDVSNKLRNLLMNKVASGFEGGVGSIGSNLTAQATSGKVVPIADITRQTRLDQGLMPLGAQMVAETKLLAHDGSIKFSVTPAFDVGRKETKVKLDLIPGSGR
jgi:tetratricopeptide (TPR) repeat protein